MFSIYRNEQALVELREAWNNGDDALRRAILAASQRVDRRLVRAPQHEGEGRDGEERILFEAPLAVRYTVDEARNLVIILRSWAYRRSPASLGDAE